jgi:hypothetical protein
VAVAAVVAAFVEAAASSVHFLSHEDFTATAGTAFSILGTYLGYVEAREVGHLLHLQSVVAAAIVQKAMKVFGD